MTTGRINQVARPACTQHDDSVSPRPGRAGLHRRTAFSASHLYVSPFARGCPATVAAAPLQHDRRRVAPGFAGRRHFIRRHLAPRQQRSGGTLAIAGRSLSQDQRVRVSDGGCRVGAHLGSRRRLASALCTQPAFGARSRAWPRRRGASLLIGEGVGTASSGQPLVTVPPTTRSHRRDLAALPRGAHCLNGVRSSTPLHRLPLTTTNTSLIYSSWWPTPRAAA